MRWCAKNEDIGSFADGPTLCFLQSILCDLFNTFFILIFLYRIGQLVNRVTFDFIEDHTRRLLRVFQFLALSEFVLSISLGFSQDESFSVAFYILTEAIAWLSVFVIVTLEVWKIQRWPWLIIKVYLGFSLFSDIMISSIVLHDSNSTATEIGICLTQIIIDLILLLISLFKDLLRSPDDLAKEELKRYSVEFLGSDPMRRSRTKEDTNTVKQLWKFFRATEDGEGISGSRSLRLRSSAAETKRWSLFGNASSGSTSKRIFEASDQMKDLISNEEEHGDEDFEISFRSSMNSQHHASFVESAIDRNSLGSGGVTTNRDSSLLKSLFSGWGGQRYSSVGSDDDLEKRSPLLSRNHHDEAALLKKEEPIRYVPTKAINRVFEENQAKISASNPVLEPRGSETSINFTAYTENPRNGNNNNYNTQTTRDSLIALNKTPFSDTDAVKYTVNVQRWGIRTRKANTPNNNTPNLSTSSTPVPFGDPSNIEKVKSSDNLAAAGTINQDFDSYVYERPKTEIEFEIVITAQLLSGADEKDWGDSAGGGIGGNVSGGNDKNSQRWIVWRTSVEVHKLHSMMVLQLGDLTPRPPRLVSAQSGGTNFTHTELISDMRAITIFVNALLRLKDGPSAKPIVDFLELERSKALFSHRTQTLVSGSGDDNDRIDIVLSRNSENQESVTGTDVESRTGRVGLGLSDVTSGTNSPKGGLPTGAGAGTVRNNVQSLMDVAELDAANNPNNQHEKWRKLFYQMRIKLKPHDIAVRCRLFEGVISGGEIAAWLIRSTSATGADAVVSQVNNRSEACAIGQELVRCGLITPVCSGFHDDDHDVDIDTLIESEMANTDRNSIIASTPVVGGGKGIKPVSLEEMNKFSDLSGYIYRLPVKSGTAGSWSLFGANITIKIPMMTMADENESMKSTRDTVVLTIDNGILAADAELEPTVTNPSDKPSTGGHVKYVIDINHGDDTWQSAKRYREFEALHKNLLKEGIRPDAPLPSKSFVNAFVRPVGFAKATLDETRRAGLETYLSSAVQAVIDNGNEKTRIILAQFLDDEFNNLRLVNSNENDGQLK